MLIFLYQNNLILVILIVDGYCRLQKHVNFKIGFDILYKYRAETCEFVAI